MLQDAAIKCFSHQSRLALSTQRRSMICHMTCQKQPNVLRWRPLSKDIQREIGAVAPGTAMSREYRSALELCSSVYGIACGKTHSAHYGMPLFLIQLLQALVFTTPKPLRERAALRSDECQRRRQEHQYTCPHARSGKAPTSYIGTYMCHPIQHSLPCQASVRRAGRASARLMHWGAWRQI